MLQEVVTRGSTSEITELVVSTNDGPVTTIKSAHVIRSGHLLQNREGWRGK